MVKGNFNTQSQLVRYIRNLFDEVPLSPQHLLFASRHTGGFTYAGYSADELIACIQGGAFYVNAPKNNPDHFNLRISAQISEEQVFEFLHENWSKL